MGQLDMRLAQLAKVQLVYTKYLYLSIHFEPILAAVLQANHCGCARGTAHPQPATILHFPQPYQITAVSLTLSLKLIAGCSAGIDIKYLLNVWARKQPMK